MICHVCNYDSVTGDKEFIHLGSKVVKRSDLSKNASVVHELYACPNCKTVRID